MRRGARRWGPIYVLVLLGIAAAAVVPVSGPAAPTAPETPEATSAYRLKVDAVAYYLPGMTASGLPVGKGVVAVDPKLIPLGTKLFVPGYGRAIAADVGWGVKGRIIDVWMPNDAAARKWGRKTVVITVFR
jgi:3D (Asp-Asp-Asp) domain-containing protein